MNRPILRYGFLALAATLPLGLLGLASYRFAAARMLEADDAANMDRARLTAEIVESELSSHLLSVAGQAQDPALVEPVARKDAAGVRRRLAAQRASVPVVGRVFVVDPAGVLWADDPRADESLGRSFAYRAWFKEAVVSEGATLSASFVRHAHPQVPVVVMAAPIRSGGRLLGLLAHQYTLEALAAHLGQRTFGRGGRILIIDSDGKPLGPVDHAEAAALPAAPPVRGALAGRSGLLAYPDAASRRTMRAAFVPVHVGGRTWGAVARVPEAEILESLSALRLRLSLATLGTALLAAFLAVQLGRAREHESRLAAELEERGRRLEEQTRVLSRSNADLEQFAYLASHDLQAPLRSLKNYCDMFQDRCGAALNDEGRRLVGLTKQSVARMQRMVSDLLEFSRLGQGKGPARPVAVGACLDDALADLASETARRRAVVERTELPSVSGHAGEITRLLQNLLSNAMKYCEAEPRIKVSARRDGRVWEVSVADNGIGVPDEKREAVFGLFERLHPWERFEGSGIGLAACRKVVERHGGRIWLESSPGKGTTVKFTLPA
ncbi:MAG: hypothetical protein HY928_08475 [Elusimicrobia bacterium]|nr:hypothetical protein [Elusimicrobiota bacterium]